MLKLLIATLTSAGLIACTTDYMLWFPRSKDADPLYRFVKHGVAGYIDGNGKVVIAPRFKVYGNGGGEFHNGLLIVDGGYIDRNGNELKGNWSTEYYSDFSEGLALVRNKAGSHFGFIDRTGKFAIAPTFPVGRSNSISNFTSGLSVVQENGKFGFIDHSGEFVVRPILLELNDFHEGLARVVVDGPCYYDSDGPCPGPIYVGGRISNNLPACKFTFIDKTGRIITEPKFDGASYFSEGLAPVRVGKLWGFINTSGTIVIKPQFESAQPFSEGLARIRVAGLYGYIDSLGAIKIMPQFQSALNFQEGMAVVGDEGQGYWYIDRRGNQAIAGPFGAASDFFKGVAHVRLHSRSRKSAKWKYGTSIKKVIEFSHTHQEQTKYLATAPTSCYSKAVKKRLR